MPQKKNPDIAELARGKAGRLIGDLTGLLATLKALPFAYNRDLQEDKEPAFDAVDTLLLVLPAMTGCVATLTVRHRADGGGRARRATRSRPRSPSGSSRGASPSGRPTRSPVPAYGPPRRAGVELADLTDADLAVVSAHLTPDVRDALTVDAALAVRSHRTAAPRRRGSATSSRRCGPRSPRRTAGAVPLAGRLQPIAHAVHLIRLRAVARAGCRGRQDRLRAGPVLQTRAADAPTEVAPTLLGATVGRRPTPARSRSG